MHAFAGRLKAIGGAFGLTALIIGTGPALAADTPKQILEAYLDRYRALGASTAEAISITQNGNVTTVEGMRIVIPFDMKWNDDYRLCGSFETFSKTAIYEGLTAEGETVRADRLTAPEGQDVRYGIGFYKPVNSKRATACNPTTLSYTRHLTYDDVEILGLEERSFELPSNNAASPFKFIVGAVANFLDSCSFKSLRSTKLSDWTKLGNRTSLYVFNNYRERAKNGVRASAVTVENFTSTIEIAENGNNRLLSRTIGRDSIIENMDLRPVFRILDPSLFRNLSNDVVWDTNSFGKTTTSDFTQDISVVFNKFALNAATFGRPNGDPIPILENWITDHLDAPERSIDELGLDALSALARIAPIKLGQFNAEAIRMSIGGAQFGQTGQIAISDISPGKIGSIELKSTGFSAPDNKGQFGFRRLLLKDVDYSKVATGDDLARAIQARDIMAILAALPIVGGLEIEDFALTPHDAPVTLSFDAYRLAQANFVGPIPTQVSSAIEGLSLPTPIIGNADAQKALSAMGLKALRIDQTLKLDWDEETGVLTLEQAGIRLENGGNATLRLTLGGVPKFVFEEPSRAQEAIATLSIKGGSLLIEDAAVITAMLEQEATKRNAATETIRSDTIAQVRAALGPLAMTPFADELSGALDQFLANPERLEIRIEPASPVYAAQLLGLAATAPDTIPGLLNTTISAD